MSAATRKSGKRRRGLLVLVVEHDAAARRAMSDALREGGYVALEAEDGAQALRLLVTEGAVQPAVIIVDLWTPNMSGPDLVRVLKSYTRLSKIPVILTTAGSPYREDAAVHAGTLSQPFDAEVLLALVNDRCGVKKASGGKASA